MLEPTAASWLKARAVAGTRWTAIYVVIGRFLTVVTMILLARALMPDELGAIAILTVIVTAGTLCQEFGTGAGLIYRRDQEEQTAGFALVFQLAVGVVLIVVTLAGAGLVADFFRTAALGPALQVLSAVYLLTPLLSVPLARLEKTLDYRAKFLAELEQAVIQSLTMVVLAFAGWGVWSFVWGLLAGKLVAAATVWITWRPAVSLAFTAGLARQTLAYSRYVFGEIMLWFVSVNIDDLLIGRFLGTSALGVYKLGFSTAVTPASSIGALTRVAFPAFVRIRDDPALLRHAFLRSTEYCVMVGMPAFALLGLLAQPVIAVLYGERWMAAAPVLRVLAPYGMLWVAAVMISDLFKAAGLVRVLFWINAGRVLLLLACLLVAVRYGVVGVAGAVLAVAIATRIVQFYWVSRVLGLGTAHYVATFGATLQATAAMLLVVIPVRALLVPLAPALDLVLHIGAGVVVYLAVFSMVGRQRIVELVGLVRAAAVGG